MHGVYLNLVEKAADDAKAMAEIFKMRESNYKGIVGWRVLSF
jgi:hypothetical protein